MSFTVPATWKIHSSSNNGNSVTYTRPGHTVQQPKLAIISRVAPLYDNKRQEWSTPSYRVRVFDGVLDANGNPDPTKTMLDLTARCSVDSNGSSVKDAVTADFRLIINHADFAASAFQSQDFPAIAAV